MAPNDEKKPPLHHVYDDIEEHDNRLPNWWLATLFGTIVFGFGYWYVYENAHSAPSLKEEYEQEQKVITEKRKQDALKSTETTDATLEVLSKDAAMVAEGEKLFKATCASCHGQKAEGLVGPNLTDKFWIHGGKPTDVHKSITTGFPEKGMPAWGPQLGNDKVRTLAAYVVSLRNTNVAGKAPQGDPVE